MGELAGAEEKIFHSKPYPVDGQAVFAVFAASREKRFLLYASPNLRTNQVFTTWVSTT